MKSTNSRKFALVLGFLLCCAMLVSPALADWDDTMPAKWVQYPDLSPMGIDVNCMEPYVLADDFLCTERGHVTGIHIWGSWLYDIIPFNEDPHAVRFILSIHKDIPADESPTGYSMPGEVLWHREFQPGEFVARKWAEGIVEGWMDPPEEYIFPADWTCWQYNFTINEDEAFFQEGTPDAPIVYWLDVQALPEDADARFGWKTSVDHWNDNAVWGQGQEPYPGPWWELYYPANHELAGHQIDLAFVIQCTDEVPEYRDFGDAPDPTYPTLLASNGAYHMIVAGAPYLGNQIDAEPDGQPSVGADRDDLMNVDDEDGVTFLTPLIPGQPASVTVVAPVGGRLDAWIDFQVNGHWFDAVDQIAGAYPLSPGVNTINFIVPGSAPFGAQSYARFRVSSYGGLPCDGPAADGEVEDYEVFFDEPHEELDFGDAPDQPYPTLLASNGACHTLIDAGPVLGTIIDLEPDGQPSPNADGDDLGYLDDEDGVTFLTAFIPGATATIDVYTATGGMLDAWIDFNANGSWADPGEQIALALPLPAGNNPITVNVPASAPVGAQTFARFRISTQGGLPWYGYWPNGEVEDYELFIEEHQEKWDFGDAPDQPYPTLLASNGARHQLFVGAPYLGAIVDSETDGQPDATATGDDVLDGTDDEDGVVFATQIIPGYAFNVNVQAPLGGMLDAWIDFDANGDWAGPGEQIAVSLPLAMGMNTLTFVAPTSTLPNATTFARFRVSSQGGLPCDGPAEDGEVEDYMIRTEEPADQWDFGDAPDQPYPTLLASNGARHLLNDGTPILGTIVDPEADGQPDATATGDDVLDGNDDEDGVTFLTQIVPGQAFSIDVYTITGGMLDAWIDYDANGSWADPGEQIAASLTLAAGNNNIALVAPANTAANTTIFARFRISSFGGLDYKGAAENGEVEDYQHRTGEAVEEWDFGDAPDRPYPTLLANNGARHMTYDGAPYLGYLVDLEPDGQPSSNAQGDDVAGGVDDEDGVTFPSLYWGQTAAIQVYTVTGGLLDAWIDYDQNGDWAGPGEQIAASHPLNPGLNLLTITLPNTGLPSIMTYARFRISTQGGLPYDGPAEDGEVEDYNILIEEVTGEYKWLQPPDLSTLGIDINASYYPDGSNYILADDFLCDTTGPITRVWVWGSWLNDLLPHDDPTDVEFTLSFHKDIPADQNPDGYSMPGETLWYRTFAPGTFTATPWATNIEEGWMDPPDYYLFPADWTCWLYVFDIPAEEAFWQLGDPDAPIVYWLDVDAHTTDLDALFGWKTSTQHWNDDATWTFGSEPYNGPWRELHYTEDHDLYGTPLDLAFRLEGLEMEVPYDFGDAPDPTYQTLWANNGARHIVQQSGLTLGYLIDAEPDGQPDPAAMGDDMNGAPDEEGVVFTSPIVPGGTATLNVFASQMCRLDAWIDFDGDGSWAEAQDRIFASKTLAPGLNSLSIQVPTTGAQGHPSFARFRVSVSGGLSYDGLAYNGEVEDYEVFIDDDATGIEDGVPTSFGLYQNMPNPFNPKTSIAYDVPADGGHVSLAIYNVNGRKVATLIDGRQPAGHHVLDWQARDSSGRQLPSGVYFYRLRAGGVDVTRKMVLLQ